jgi:hypothetical protein
VRQVGTHVWALEGHSGLEMRADVWLLGLAWETGEITSSSVLLLTKGLQGELFIWVLELSWELGEIT